MLLSISTTYMHLNMKEITIKLNWWNAIKDIKKKVEMEKLWIEIKRTIQVNSYKHCEKGMFKSNWKLNSNK